MAAAGGRVDICPRKDEWLVSRWFSLTWLAGSECGGMMDMLGYHITDCLSVLSGLLCADDSRSDGVRSFSCVCWTMIVNR